MYVHDYFIYSYLHFSIWPSRYLHHHVVEHLRETKKAKYIILIVLQWAKTQDWNKVAG